MTTFRVLASKAQSVNRYKNLETRLAKCQHLFQQTLSQ